MGPRNFLPVVHGRMVSETFLTASSWQNGSQKLSAPRVHGRMVKTFCTIEFMAEWVPELSAPRIHVE
jgi:hypothetical protein